VFTARYGLDLFSIIQANILVYNRDSVFTARYELNLLSTIQDNILIYNRDCVHCAVRAESLKHNSG
jgi:hypothetical protein